MKKLNHKKISSFLSLIIFLFGFIYWIFDATKNPTGINQPNAPTSQENTNSSEIIFGTARVIDGDTIEINKKRIRLIGIDAPESKQKCLDKNYSEYLCGEVSTNFLKNWIENKSVKCWSNEKDIYKRYLGSCKFGEININYEMVKNGMAIIYNLKDADEELKTLEKTAMNKKIGIWQGAFEEPKDYRKKNRRYHK